MSRASRELKQRRAEYHSALLEMRYVQEDLTGAYLRFENITDPCELEACILEISALKSKYNNTVRNIKLLYI